MSLSVFFISLLIVAQHVSGKNVLIIRSWRLRDVIASCWYVPWLQGGCQDRLAGSASMDGGGFMVSWSLWGVENCIRKYGGLRVVEMVICSKLSMNVESLYCVKVGSYSVAVCYLHVIVYGAKWEGFFGQMFCKTGGIAVVAKRCLEFFVPCGELSACLSDIRLVAIRASQFIYTW
jgi:hypothetical protein